MPDIGFEEDRQITLARSRAIRSEEYNEHFFSLKGAAERIAGMLNKRIEEGEVTSAFTVAMAIAAFKDLVLDPIAGITAPVGIGFIIGALSLLVSATLVLFLLGKGWFLRMRARLLLWGIGLFIDGIAGLSIIPINMAMVYIAWRNVKKDAEKARTDLGDLHNKTSSELEILEKEYEDYRYSAS